MEFEHTGLDGVVVIRPKVFGDDRGFFFESYRRDTFVEAGIDEDFVQDNHAYSNAGVVRGLHYQRDPHAQGKLVRVVAGSVFDVVVDLRKGSPTFGKWFGVELSGENHVMMYVPPGFAHGYVTLKDETHFLYSCTNYYAPEAEGGLLWSDPELGIEWPIDMSNVTVNERDQAWPGLEDAALAAEFEYLS